MEGLGGAKDGEVGLQGDGGVGVARGGAQPDSIPPGGSFRPVLSPGDLMLTHGFNYHPDSDDSHVYGSSQDVSPQLPVHIFSRFLNTFSGMLQRHLQLNVTSWPAPCPACAQTWSSQDPVNDGQLPGPDPSPPPGAFTPEHLETGVFPPLPTATPHAQPTPRPSSLTWVMPVASSGSRHFLPSSQPLLRFRGAGAGSGGGPAGLSHRTLGGCAPKLSFWWAPLMLGCLCSCPVQK